MDGADATSSAASSDAPGRWLGGARPAHERLRAQALPRIGLSPREVSDLLTIGIGAAAPLRGFMDRRGRQRSCSARASSRWPLPLTLSVDRVAAESLEPGDSLGLYDPSRDEVLATLSLEEMHEAEPALEALALYSGLPEQDPALRALRDQGEVLLAGPVRLLSLGGYDERYGDCFLTPAQARQQTVQRGWRRVVAVDAAQADWPLRMEAALKDAQGVMLLACAGRLVHSDYAGEEAALALIRTRPPPQALRCVLPFARRGSAELQRRCLHAVARNYGCAALY